MALAKLEIGVEIDSTSVYNSKWQTDDQVTFKDLVWEEIQAKVPRGMWAFWEGLKLTKEHLSEAEIQVEITNAFTAHRADANTTHDMSLAASEPHCVKYVWRNGERICIHCYSIEIAPTGTADTTLWEVSHTSSDGDKLVASLRAEFSWASEA